MKFAPEGRPFLVVGWSALVILGLVAWARGGAWWLGWAAWVPVAAWLPVFFRDPPRTGERGERVVIAPADGKIVAVAATQEPDYVKGPALRVSIFMSIFDVHVNRYPASGTVEYRDYRPGQFVNAAFDKASEENERMSIGIRTSRGQLLVRQIAGLIARRIVADHGIGEGVQQGERLGMIRFGSRVDTFLPSGAVARVRVGDRARAGETVIAEWVS